MDKGTEKVLLTGLGLLALFYFLKPSPAQQIAQMQAQNATNDLINSEIGAQQTANNVTAGTSLLNSLINAF